MGTSSSKGYNNPTPSEQSCRLCNELHAVGKFPSYLYQPHSNKNLINTELSTGSGNSWIFDPMFLITGEGNCECEPDSSSYSLDVVEVFLSRSKHGHPTCNLY